MSLLEQRIVPWIDPISGDPLLEKDNFLVRTTSKYSINDGVPDFVTKLDDAEQIQVKNAFGYKWTKTDFGQNRDLFYDNIRDTYLDMMGISEKNLNIFHNKIVLDVGIGSGSSARLWGDTAKEFHGVDISEAVYKASSVLRTEFKNAYFAQADLNLLPFPDESFDVIVSNGVLHHTKSTKTALGNIIKK